VSGGDPRQVTFDGQRNSRGSLASPDGKFLYFNRENRLWRRDLSTDQETPIEQLSTLYLTRDWDIARGGIYFLEPDSGDQLRLYRLDLATGNRSLIKQLTSKRNLYVPNLSVSPDEQRYALTTISNESCDIMLGEGWR
ncbi:MAG: TolB family protein, partial [Acidobacteriota bacterium]